MPSSPDLELATSFWNEVLYRLHVLRGDDPNRDEKPTDTASIWHSMEVECSFHEELPSKEALLQTASLVVEWMREQGCSMHDIMPFLSDLPARLEAL